MNTLETRFKRLPYKDRASHSKNALAKRLFHLLDAKATNLALSADVTSADELIALAINLGAEICVLKTHIDILKDYQPNVTAELVRLAKQYEFMLFEDRKFADIGHTVKEQYAGGLYQIANWAELINAHTLPGPGIISGLAQVGIPKHRGLLLLAEMSSANNLFTADYTASTVKMAHEFAEFVIGFISQHNVSPDAQWLHLTPGVQFGEEKDALGQQYITPKIAIQQQQSDIIIVGRGILQAQDPLLATRNYRQAGWQAYQDDLYDGKVRKLYQKLS